MEALGKQNVFVVVTTVAKLSFDEQNVIIFLRSHALLALNIFFVIDV